MQITYTLKLSGNISSRDISYFLFFKIVEIKGSSCNIIINSSKFDFYPQSKWSLSSFHLSISRTCFFLLLLWQCQLTPWKNSPRNKCQIPCPFFTRVCFSGAAEFMFKRWDNRRPTVKPYYMLLACIMLIVTHGMNNLVNHDYITVIYRTHPRWRDL